MSAVIAPLTFIDARHGEVASAASQVGFGWYTVSHRQDGMWTAEHSLDGLIGAYATKQGGIVACGAADFSSGRKWLRDHP